MRISQGLVVLVVLAALPVRPADPAARALPVRYAADRFFVEPTRNGQTFSLFTDTGGGLFLSDDAVAALGLSVVNKTVPWPDWNLPAPLGRLDGRIPVATPNLGGEKWSGMLGQPWFAGRVWTFDYPRRQLLLWDSPPPSAGHEIELGFWRNDKGERHVSTSFPRLNVTVDGQELPLLFDTGATTILTPEAIPDGGPASRATSFITASVFQRWQAAHPDWRVSKKADTLTGEPMIEVPRVTVAGYEVGPVWFTRRPDRNFHEYMAQWMDTRSEGALGGNAFRHFRITVDYPNARAWFER